MSSGFKPKTYRSHHPLRAILRILGALAILAVVLAICIFVGFRKYIVYTADGLYLDVPWLEDSTGSPASDLPSVPGVTDSGDADTAESATVPPSVSPSTVGGAGDTSVNSLPPSAEVSPSVSPEDTSGSPSPSS